MAAWFSATTAGGPFQLYKLGFDESVTQWTADPGSGGTGLAPQDLTFFNSAVWFGGVTLANGLQLFKLGNDGSVTKWTSIGTELIPVRLDRFQQCIVVRRI